MAGARVPGSRLRRRPGVGAVVLQQLHEDPVAAGDPEIHHPAVAHLDAQRGAHVIDRVEGHVEVDLETQHVAIERERALHVRDADAAMEEAADQ